MDPKPVRPRRSWSAPVVLGVSLLLTALVTTLIDRMEAAKDQQRFQNAVQRTRDSITDRLDDDLALLRSVAGLLAAHPALDRAAFHTYAAQMDLKRHCPGVQGVGFSLRFRPAEQPALEARMRREGEGAFHVWPAVPNAERHAILYLEPRDARNRRAIGYNMASDPTRFAAMERARDTGRAVASGRVTLVQETAADVQPGFLIYLPVYRGGALPQTVGERRGALLGFVYSPFRARDLLSGVFGSEKEPRLHFQVLEGPPSAQGDLLYSSDPAESGARTPLRGRFHIEQALTVAERPWTVRFATVPGFESGSSAELVPLTLLAGLLVSGLLFGITSFQVRAREAAERNAVELRRSQAARQAGEDQLRLITDAAPALICYVDAEERYRFNNAAYEHWFRRSREEVWGKSLREVLGPEGYAMIAPHVKEVLAGRAADYEGPLRCPDCGVRHVHASYVPHKAPDGRVLGFVALISDISARRDTELDNARLYQEAQEARAAAETANRLKDEFLATLSHELRTPLNAILGYSQLLLQGGQSEAELARGLEAIERNVKAQAQLINDLLDVSRVISGKMRLELRPVDLAAVIEAAIEAVAPLAATRNIRLEREIEPALPPVPADAVRLQQVVWNLLTNAIKFTPAGGRVGVQAFRCSGVQAFGTTETDLPLNSSDLNARTPERLNTYVAIAIQDTGMGIDPAFLPHVFDRFRQEDSSTTRRHGGLGLGLAIVRHLVELHGGTVHAESEGPGRGSRFTVTLPLAQGQADGEMGEPAAASPSVPLPNTLSPDTHFVGTRPLTPTAPQPPRLDGLRVLVVDDERDARELIERILVTRGAAVTPADGVAEALAAWAEAAPEVLISDLGMPGEDGYALLRRVRSFSPAAGGKVPAAALSAFAGPEDRRRALAAGFQVHVPKPVDAEELVRVVARLAGRLPE